MRALGLILIPLLVALSAAPAWAQQSTAQERLPAGLVVDAPLAWGVGNIFDPFNACTSSVFPLSEETAKAIGKKGILALDALGNRPADGSDWRYSPWIGTPVDTESRESWSENGYVWGGLACGLSADWQAKSQRIGTKYGSFYSFGRGVLVLVDPDRRLVIYTQRDSLH